MDKYLTTVKSSANIKAVTFVPKRKYQFGAVFFFLLIHAGVLAVWWTRPTKFS